MNVVHAVVRPTRKQRLAAIFDELHDKGCVAVYSYHEAHIHSGEDGRLDPRWRFEAIVPDDGDVDYVVKKVMRSCQSHHQDDGWLWVVQASRGIAIKTGEPLKAPDKDAAE